MIVKQYRKCIQELDKNPNIKFIDHLTNLEVCNLDKEMLEDEKEDLAELGNIILSDTDLECFNLSSISVGWDCLLDEPKGIKVLRGGFVFNGLTDALLFPSSFWRGGVSLAPNEEVPNKHKHYEKLNWFEHLPTGINDMIRGCFIREEGKFPPPI